MDKFIKNINNEENIKIAVVTRPLNEYELKIHSKISLKFEDECTATIEKEYKDGKNQKHTFEFDAFYNEKTKNEEIYNNDALPVIENVMNGYNGTIFCYGQTGSGKTYTMVGQDSKEKFGIIPRSFESIFSVINNNQDTKYVVSVYFYEIYGEEVNDLLNIKNKKLEVKENKDKSFYVKNLTTVTVNNPDDLLNLLNTGKKNRITASTLMNSNSSRSHLIFCANIESSYFNNEGIEIKCLGQLNFIDLAGSERIQKSGCSGDRLKEAININLSLATLGNVIYKLSDGNRGSNSHTPYRDSKLTKLLKHSLGGNSKTIIFVNISPSQFNYDETLCSLRYAQRAKNVKNTPRINYTPSNSNTISRQESISNKSMSNISIKSVNVNTVKRVVSKLTA